MRLIDADAVLEHFAEYWAMQKKLKRPSKQQYAQYMTMRSMVNSFKTEDAVPVIHGHWLVNMFFIECSECGETFPLEPQNYCPHCGARMDEE